MTNQNGAGLNWTNRKFVIGERGLLGEEGREDIVNLVSKLQLEFGA